MQTVYVVIVHLHEHWHPTVLGAFVDAFDAYEKVGEYIESLIHPMVQPEWKSVSERMEAHLEAAERSGANSTGKWDRISRWAWVRTDNQSGHLASSYITIHRTDLVKISNNESN